MMSNVLISGCQAHFLDWPNYSPRACGSNSTAPAYTLLLIFLDVTLPYLNNILMGNSGLEFIPSDAYGSQTTVKKHHLVFTTFFYWLIKPLTKNKNASLCLKHPLYHFACQDGFDASSAQMISTQSLKYRRESWLCTTHKEIAILSS